MSSVNHPMINPSLLIIDDNENLVASISRALSDEFVIANATNAHTAIRAFAKQPDIVLLDIRLDEADVENKEGMNLLQHFLASRPEMPVIMFTAHANIEMAVECMRLGATDFIQKSAGISELRHRLTMAIDNSKLSRQVRMLEERLGRLESSELIGDSPMISRIKTQVQMVAQDGYATVLIRGETGTGKELVANAIHRYGWRSKEPFVPVTLGSLNPNLVESELFGHEPGSFTGARNRRIGLIERAKNGVLFLDEVGDLPLETQSKVMRFIEERSFSRVGSSDPIPINIQIISATNRNLEDAVKRGEIRADLYFRLKSIQIFLPTLGERLEDIPLLITHFLNLFRKQGRTRITDASDKVVEWLTHRTWPGNVRELRAVLERAVIYANFHGHQQIEIVDLLETSHSTLISSGTPNQYLQHDAPITIDLDEELATFELNCIDRALATEERKSEAWRVLGLNDRFALRRRVQRLFRRYPKLSNKYGNVARLYGFSEKLRNDS